MMGYLKYNDKEQEYTFPKRLEKGNPLQRVHVFDYVKIWGEISSTDVTHQKKLPVTEKKDAEIAVTNVTDVTDKKSIKIVEEFSEEKIKKNNLAENLEIVP